MWVFLWWDGLMDIYFSSCLFLDSYVSPGFAWKAVKITAVEKCLHKTKQNLNLFYFSN